MPIDGTLEVPGLTTPLVRASILRTSLGLQSQQISLTVLPRFCHGTHTEQWC